LPKPLLLSSSFEFTSVTSNIETDERERESERENVIPPGILSAEAKMIHFALTLEEFV